VTDSLRAALRQGPVVLDGGLATELEAQGHDLSSALWSARLLRDDPEAIMAAHRSYFAAGAQVATTASYQAAGRPELLRTSVRLAQQARAESDDSRPRWVAGSVGPYGAALADGSEYRGDYGLTVAELRVWHRPTIAALVDAGVDLLACETIPCLAEVEALLAEVDGLGVACWLSLTCAQGRTRAGEPVAEAYAMARGVDEVVAVGVNCTAPAEVGALVRVAAESSGKPVVAYPNGGEDWDAVTRQWVGPSSFDPAWVSSWVADGARLVGGCCRVGPAQIGQISRVLGSA
jgi:homocysteine S-methyltransferase